jgi:hypothetical protein
MIGDLVDELHLRAQIEEDDTFLDLLDRLNSEFCSTYEHPGFCRIASVAPECTTDLLFNWQQQSSRDDRSSAQYGELTVLPFPIELRLSTKLLPLFSDGDAGIKANFIYRRDVLATSTVENLSENLRTLAEAVTVDPSRRIGSIILRQS